MAVSAQSELALPVTAAREVGAAPDQLVATYVPSPTATIAASSTLPRCCHTPRPARAATRLSTNGAPACVRIGSVSPRNVKSQLRLWHFFTKSSQSWRHVAHPLRGLDLDATEP